MHICGTDGISNSQVVKQLKKAGYKYGTAEFKAEKKRCFRFIPGERVYKKVKEVSPVEVN